MKVIFKNNNESIDVNVIDEFNGELYQISYDEVVRLLKLNKFNDDKFGQIMASYEGFNDDDPYWIYVEDIEDQDEYEMFDDYDYFYILPATERGTEVIIKESKRVLSFDKFNEDLSSSYINGEFDSDDSNNKIIIKLELEVNQDMVDRIQKYIDDLGLSCTSTELLHDFFLYNSGYEFDDTYGFLLDKWIEENQDDYS